MSLPPFNPLVAIVVSLPIAREGSELANPAKKRCCAPAPAPAPVLIQACEWKFSPGLNQTIFKDLVDSGLSPEAAMAELQHLNADTGSI